MRAGMATQNVLLPRPTRALESTLNDDDSRALLASRLAAYIGVLLGTRIVVMLVLTFAESATHSPTAWWSRSSGQIGIGVTVALFAVVFLLKRVKLPLGALEGIDFALTLGVALAAAVSLVLDAAKGSSSSLPGLVSLASSEVKAVLAVAHLLLLRAAIIPSPPLRTAGIGVGTACLLSAGSWLSSVRSGASPASVLPFVDSLIWSTYSVAISCACSAVIYGLRRQVRDATRMGQYTLEAMLGQGGMGTVYRARHALLRRPTAIKILSPDRLGPAALERFEREVQATARLSHPNIVPIYDFGRSQTGTFYYAMEYLDGVDLQRLVELTGPLPAGRVVHLLRQAADALAEAHAVQLIHRDIKPANMVLTQRAAQADILKLVDFGLVRELSPEHEAAASLSATNQIQGTPLYMAPEAIIGPATMGPGADLYALGAVAYFLLTGSPVFEGMTTVAVLAKHAHQAPVPPSECVAGLPRKLEIVVMRCLEKDPQRRFANAEELLQALAECDDVPTWTQKAAHAWWQTRRPATPSAALPLPYAQTMAVDLRQRGEPRF